MLKKMKNKTHFAVLCFFVLCACAAFPANAEESEKGSHSMAAEQAQCPGMAIVSIKTDVDGSTIIVNGQHFGFTSWTGQLRPGTHSVRVSADDHYSVFFFFTLQENMKYVISVHLEPYTGLLSVVVSPEDAELYVDGNRVWRGLVEIPTGKHTLTAKKFGYDEQSIKFYIARDRTSYIQLALKPSRFEFKKFSVSPKAVNPANRGIYGKLFIRFTVSGPGFGSVEVRDDGGNIVRTIKLDEFTTWSQECFWDGTDDSGERVKDREYEFLLTLWPLRLKPAGGDAGAPLTTPGAPPAPPILLPHPQAGPQMPPVDSMPDPGQTAYDAPLKASGKARIDSSLRIVPEGTAGARPGLMFCANPRVRDMLPFSIDFELTVGDGIGGTMDMGFKAGKNTMLAFEGMLNADTSLGFAAGLLSSLYSQEHFDAAVLARVAWNDPGTISPDYGSELEIALPLSATKNGFSVGISPGLVVNLKKQSFCGRLGTGVWYETQELVTGVSAMTDMGAAPLASSANPLFWGLEARFLADSLPFTLTARLETAFTPVPTGTKVRLGAGFAF